MREKIMRGLLVIAATMFVSATAIAALNEAGACEIARQWVPKGAVYLSTKDEIDEYEVEFLVHETNSKYQIDVNKNTAMVAEVKTKLRGERGSLTVKLNESDVTAIVLSEFPGSQIGQVKLESDDGYRKYEVKFTNGPIRGEMEINPETGVILERDIKY